MDVFKYLTVLIVLYLGGGETGGGGKHYEHVKLHIPEFHHYDHHKKVITIHHHHHAPKKEHHHHHHHHHKPHIPHGHHYSHHRKKVHLKTHTVSKGDGGHHGSHGHHGNHHMHLQHHGHQSPQHDHHYGGHGLQNHYGHYGNNNHHGFGSHNDVPSISYTQNAIPSYEDEYTSGHSYDSGASVSGFVPQIPQVHGISHTVKQVNVFDSLPGALPTKDAVNSYAVTEEGEEGEERFISLDNLKNTYPATYGYVQAAAASSSNNPFEGITTYNSDQHSRGPFSMAVSNSKGIESFSGSNDNDPFSSALLSSQSNDLPSASPSASYPLTFDDNGFDDPENTFAGSDGEGATFISNDDNSISVNNPVSFTREAGIQQTTKTGNVQTLVY